MGVLDGYRTSELSYSHFMDGNYRTQVYLLERWRSWDQKHQMHCIGNGQ